MKERPSGFSPSDLGDSLEFSSRQLGDESNELSTNGKCKQCGGNCNNCGSGNCNCSSCGGGKCKAE